MSANGGGCLAAGCNAVYVSVELDRISSRAAEWVGVTGALHECECAVVAYCIAHITKQNFQ